MTWTAVARHQSGLISRRQLLAAGLADTTIDDYLAYGRLEATSTVGVYRVGGAAETESSAAWYAALSSRSPVSFLSATRWWGHTVPDDGLVHITRMGRRRLDWPPGVRVHRVAITTDVIVRHRGLWVTTQTESLLDTLGWLPFAQAMPLADRVVQRNVLSPSAIHARLRDQPRRWGNARLRKVLSTLTVGAAAESERRLHRLLRSGGVRGWVGNLRVILGASSYELDVAFPELRVAIEIDGFEYHSQLGRFQADRTKQNALVAAGWVVLRFTWADLVERPEQVLARIYEVVLARSVKFGG